MPAQAEVVSLIDPGSSILEVGCATGYMTSVLSEERGCRVTAIEMSQEMAEQASPFAERIIVGDITDPLIWDRIGTGFDHVIFADVLEHLRDPWAVLKKTRECLNTGGSVVCSIPNVAHYRIRLKLLVGKFEYKRYGILDDTHLRFFTASSIRSMFADTCYTVAYMKGMNWRPVETLMTRFLPNAFAVQFVVKAVPTNAVLRGTESA